MKIYLVRDLALKLNGRLLTARLLRRTERTVVRPILTCIREFPYESGDAELQMVLVLATTEYGQATIANSDVVAKVGKNTLFPPYAVIELQLVAKDGTFCATITEFLFRDLIALQTKKGVASVRAHLEKQIRMRLREVETLLRKELYLLRQLRR